MITVLKWNPLYQNRKHLKNYKGHDSSQQFCFLRFDGVNMISFVYEKFTLFPSCFFKAFKSDHSFWQLQLTLFCFQYVLSFTLNKVQKCTRWQRGNQHFVRRPTCCIPQWHAVTLYGGMPPDLTVKYLTYRPRENWPPKGNTIMNT